MYTLRSTLGGRVLVLLHSPTLRNCPCIIRPTGCFEYLILLASVCKPEEKLETTQRREVLQALLFFDISLRGKGETTTTVGGG